MGNLSRTEVSVELGDPPFASASKGPLSASQNASEEAVTIA